MPTMFSKLAMWVPVLLLLPAGSELRAQTPDTSYAWILFAGGG